jgi:hypothetical protein
MDMNTPLQIAGRDKDGNVVYDLSDDQARAEAGDENARQRLETKRLIAMRQMSRQTRGE